jgi:hypothetical protein
MENLNQSTQTPNPSTGSESEAIPVSTMPMASKPLGMPGVSLDSGLASRVNQANKTKRHFGLKSFIIIAIVLLFLGSGAWFYVAYGQGMWLNRGADLPTWENYKENVSFSLKLHDILDEKGVSSNQDFLGLGEGVSLEGAGLGVIYNNHQSANQSSGQIKLTLNAKDLSFNFNTFFKKIDQNIYVKPELNKLEIPSLQNPLDLGEEWVEVSMDDIDKWINESNAADANKSVEEYLQDSQKKEEEFFKRVTEQKFFTYKDTHESKPTPSGQIRKFDYSVAPGKLNDLIKTIDELMYDSKMTDDEKGFLTKFLEVAKVSVWINTKNRFIQEINVEALNIAFKDDFGSRQFDIVLNYEISEASAQTVVKPEPTIKFLDFSNKIMSQFFSPENYLQFDEANPDMSVDTDGDGLLDFEEDLYGTDVNKVDTDGDGYSDAEEIENGYNPLGPGTLDSLPM